MLTREENELLTRVGPGTPMGETLRRYWIPALEADELREPGGAPVRAPLLGEKLIAYRDGSGKIGFMAEGCLHRGASLYYGRNEPDGLRCIYHGWKYDVCGNITDLPNAPEGNIYHGKLHLKAYPGRELGGVIWVYMGPPDQGPALPEFEWTKLPDSHKKIVKVSLDCNYLQGIEGGLDTSHISFLHRRVGDAEAGNLQSQDTAPRLEAQDASYGFRYGSIRQVKSDNGHQSEYVRITPFVLPWYTMTPSESDDEMVSRLFHAWVPIDDEKTWVYYLKYCPGRPVTDKDVANYVLERDANLGKVRNLSNDYLQDRKKMHTRGEWWSGIDGLLNQDAAVQESAGAIYDRTNEHLVSADIAVAKVRQVLLHAVREFQAGKKPPALDPSIRFDRIRSEKIIVPKGTPWKTLGVQEGVEGNR
jgi:nitrite reductase/ring-hydroxylating ferredoxin subunit